MEELLGNPGWLRLVLDVLTVLITVGFSLIIYLLKKITKNNEQIINAQKDLIKVNTNFEILGGAANLAEKITAHIASAPDKQDIAEIHRRVDEVFGLVKKMEGEISGIKNITDTLYKTHIKS